MVIEDVLLIGYIIFVILFVIWCFKGPYYG